MSEQRLPSPGEIPHRVRNAVADLGEVFRPRPEPAAQTRPLWRRPLVQAMLWIAAAVLVVIGIQTAIRALAPKQAGSNVEEATSIATLYVACANPACRTSYTTRKPMTFKQWPLPCEKCGQPSVYRATLCPKCRTWYAQPPGSTEGCHACAARAAAEKKRAQPATKPADPDDAEDDW